MRYVPADEDDAKELQQMKAQPWMIECLTYNPSFTGWGPGEDHMSTRGEGWGVSLIVTTWGDFRDDFGPPDMLNEVVNFYFEIESGDDGAARLEVTFWFIHPGRGSSRGVRVERIERDELPKVLAYLRKARRRNADRFAKVPKKGARHA